MMEKLKDGDLVTASQAIRFMNDGKVLLEIPEGTLGVLKKTGNKVSVKFVGFPQCTVSRNEIKLASPLDKMAWDFSEMDETKINRENK